MRKSWFWGSRRSQCIIVTEIPKAAYFAIWTLVNESEGIANIRDESDRNGMRVVYILKRDATPNVVLHYIEYTQLQSSFSVNNIAIVKVVLKC
jgi:DNA gyrase subunit A